MNREAIYSALFSLVSAAPGLVTVNRTLRHWSDVQPSEMPALFQVQGAQTPTTVRGFPARWDLGAALWVYVSTNGAASPGSALNPIVDAIAKMLAWQENVTVQNLGGLVEYARIEGTAETAEGTLGQIEVIKIPIKMLAVT